ncbi:MAG: SIS domain-containing protein [Rhodanobacteraceae bacterium]|nr:MAG: SIS domain-containing protein [Rhodanobacteraceae bacterium]
MTIQQVFAEHAEVVQSASTTLLGPLEDATRALQTCLAQGHKVLACGNGGSAASAQHLVAELVCRFHVDRKALAAVALAADMATVTAIANDYGYGRIFARQVEALATRGDVLVALSTSGHSANVVDAAKTAHTLGCAVVALTGGDGGALGAIADIVICVPSTVVARIQEVHDVCIHALAEALEDYTRQRSAPCR